MSLLSRLCEDGRFCEDGDCTRSPLAVTLEFVASHIPFYRQQGLTGATSIADFPVIDGRLIADRFHEFYHLTSVPDFIATTGGTSGGRSKALLLNYGEMESAFFARLGDDIDRDATGRFSVDPHVGLAILLSDHQHGFVLPPGHGQPVLTLPLEVGRHFELVIRMLREGLVIGGRRIAVTQLFGSITKLRVLTEYCAAQGLSSADFDVGRIIAFAFYTSERWKLTIADFWQADVTDAYGLTEFIGAVAVRCDGCGGFHVPPIVHSEYLDDDDQPLDGEGAARLVLTTLLPHRSAMPLVRYATGDVVHVLPRCRLHHGRGFALCGRSEAVLRDPANRKLVLLTPFDVMEAVEVMDARYGDLIVYDEQVSTVMGWGLAPPTPDLSRAGYPQLNCAVREGRLQVSIEVRTSNHTTSGDLQREMLERFRHILRDRAPASPETEQRVDVSILPPGGLARAGLRVTLV